ncbi:MAG: hypothetical protein HGA22_10610 [Clostridiales bacterium]|nr:hypothetical protein [Clostridiales bacterium]
MGDGRSGVVYEEGAAAFAISDFIGDQTKPFGIHGSGYDSCNRIPVFYRDKYFKNSFGTVCGN